MIDLITVGEAIAKRRAARRMTQTALASAANVSRARLDALENGRAGELGFAKIARLLAALGLDLKIVEAGAGRPTLEDLLREDADQGLDQRR